MKKPIYLGVVVWGKRHSNYLLEYCVPTLLASNNIPALTLGKQNKFIIATTAMDWNYITAHPAINELRQYIEVVHIEIPPCPPGYPSVLHMGIGHKIMTQMMWEDKAYGGIVTSDQVFADGCMRFLQEKADQGYDAIFTPACFRTRDDQLFPALHQFKIKNAVKNPQALIVGKQEMVKAISMSIHDAFKIYEWGKVRFNPFCVGVYWRIFEKEKFKGFIFYTMAWAMSLADYSIIKEHDASMLDTTSFDAKYIDTNFGTHKNVYFVTDSDEFISTSWSEADEYPITVTYSDRNKFQDAFTRLMIMSRSFWNEVYDDFKRRNYPRTLKYGCDGKINKPFFVFYTKILIYIGKAKTFKVFTKIFDTFSGICWKLKPPNLLRYSKRIISLMLNKFGIRPILKKIKNVVKQRN